MRKSETESFPLERDGDNHLKQLRPKYSKRQRPVSFFQTKRKINHPKGYNASDRCLYLVRP